jgi:hypothetical protein
MSLVVDSKYRGTQEYVLVLSELVRAAQYDGTTTYQDIAVIMQLSLRGNHMQRETGQMLGEIVEDEVRAGRPMLSSVTASVSGKPGGGFFALARDFGKLTDGADENVFWRAEQAATYETWRRSLPK